MSESLDTGRLAEWMDTAALPGKGEPLTARFLSGGTLNVIFEINRGEHRCVLRIPPPVRRRTAKGHPGPSPASR